MTRTTKLEIYQQPETWIDTARRVGEARARLAEMLDGIEWLALTGSGSSQYVGECVHPALQAEIGVPAFTFGGGWLLTEGLRAVPRARPGLLVSLARSGDSPESAAVVDLFLDADPQVRHLVITCNAEGRLATRFARDPCVTVLALDERTNDRSLVMTSSFTNMVIAARALGRPDGYEQLVERLARSADHLLGEHAGTLDAIARSGIRKAVYLGGGCRLGAARESALKMLEMTAGRVSTMAETCLGLRHGPMCLVDRETLVVCFLASGRPARAYEEDLLAELDRKELGARKLIVGERIPASLLMEDDVALEIPCLAALGDANVAVLDTMVGQLLGFHRCLAEGLDPDQPSTGAISRVVNAFTIHQNGKN